MNQTQIKARTERAKNNALAQLRRGRKEAEMTGRIRKAWAQLDVAVEEVVRLNALIKRLEDDKEAPAPGFIASFQRDLDLEKAKANGKAEILAIIMPAPLTTPEEISREAGRRWQAKQQGIKYETPGIRLVAATVMDDIDGDPVWT